MPEQSEMRLIHRTTETYSGSFGPDLLEQYKLYVKSAENVSARRLASSRHLLTLSSALVALYGLQSPDLVENYWTLLIPVVGITVSALWYLIIKSHSDLNRVKFKIVHELEEHLPAAMFKYEWQLAEGGKGNTYRTVTTFEKWVPIVFATLHVALAIMIIHEIVGIMDSAQSTT